MKEYGLSYNARKALEVHVGVSAGAEIANLMAEMASEIDFLRRTKVNVTNVVPTGDRMVQSSQAVEETV